jgi:hypothetical protein
MSLTSRLRGAFRLVAVFGFAAAASANLGCAVSGDFWSKAPSEWLDFLVFW